LLVTAHVPATVVVEVETSQGLILRPRVMVDATAHEWQVGAHVEPALETRALAILRGADAGWFYDAELEWDRSSTPVTRVSDMTGRDGSHGSRVRGLFSDALARRDLTAANANGRPRYEDSFCDFCD
jgi:hypothetical protein